MGLLSMLRGNASEVNVERIEAEFEDILIDGEEIVGAYKIVRDMIVFTSKRLILVDRQNVTGTKNSYMSIPYGDITRFSIETTGTFDTDSELRLWLRGEKEPLVEEFRSGNLIHEVHRTLARHVLG